MASCRQIEGLLQTVIDRESGESDRVVVEQHLSECARCQRLYQRQQRACAVLFEVFDEHRLREDLVPAVMAHLPEMDNSFIEAREMTYRVKHPVTRGGRLLRLTTALAPVLVLLLGLMLAYAWPSNAPAGQEVIGMVMFHDGAVMQRDPGESNRDQVRLREAVHAGSSYDTGRESRLMLSLAGPAEVKLAGESWLHVRSPREVRLEAGRAWLNVNRDVRLFRVCTPVGNVVVLGTVFEVEVEDGLMTVTCGEGRVHVENGIASRDLLPGEQVKVRAGDTELNASRVDAASRLAWADGIGADPSTQALFAETVGMHTARNLSGEQVFVVQTNGRSIHQVSIEWTVERPDMQQNDGYYVYVSDDHMNLIFVHRIPAELFSDIRRQSYDITVPDEPVSDVRVLHIKVIPAGGQDNKRVSFTRVSAWGI